MAYHAGHWDEPVVAYSDQNGDLSMTLPYAGAWLIRTVHMVAQAESGRARWRSYWASLTFQLPPREEAQK